ncbi:MAG: O-antigen ligase family protein [Rhodospirillales bacterium]|jgi:O-antigen ligase|nr:O-antigen ligase family protein [Rhodospirillales bacterium]MBT4626108.1 O-antigen ligase family protein [Rhodospirillales bacterium]MBT5522248.1 O-antigen ligase family protein [Rhodospirillales bacterium]MBT6109367.1 O-antigen ligase family protein [Rhodospirillales bacterium]MBT7777629.1 O-antigen ligase family protein [Rhodospirillales bacterium]
MIAPYSQSKLELVAAGFAALFAVGLQILTTVHFGATAVRFGITDLLIPVVFIIWFAVRRCGAPSTIQWQVPHLWVWLGLMSGWLVISVFIGHYKMGEWTIWAVVSKGVGWFSLITYFWAGGILRTWGDYHNRERFFRVLVLFAAFACIVSFGFFVTYKSGFQLNWGEVGNYDRLRGFSQNTNAFAILTSIAFVICIGCTNPKPLFTPIVESLIGGVFLAGILLCGSRSGFLAVLVGTIGLAIARALRWRAVAFSVIIALGIGLLVLVFAEAGNNILAEKDGGGGHSAYLLHSPMVSNKSLDHRLTNIQSAISLWRDSPITGIGIGGFLANSSRLTLNNPSTLHNSALWVLTEMGLVGLALFSGFFLYVTWHLYRRARAVPSSRDAQLLFAILLGFAAASIGTEILYQRHLWFLGGFLLALPTSVRVSPDVT